MEKVIGFTYNEHGIRIGLDGPLKGESPLSPEARKTIKKVNGCYCKSVTSVDRMIL